MLYDPKWEARTKPDAFSLESLIAWLEKMPAEKRYCYNDAGRCLLARYFLSCGKNPFLGHTTVSFDLDGPTHNIPESFQKTAQTSPWRYGAALSRARAALTAER